MYHTIVDDDDTVNVCVLSRYTQAMIIGAVIYDHDFKDNDHCNGFKILTTQQASHLMINKRPRKKENTYVTFKQVCNIALVSKWWMEVVCQTTSKSLKITGPMKESRFSSSDNNNVDSLKWKVAYQQVNYFVNNNQQERYGMFDYSILPLFLPNLKTIYIKGVDASKEAIQDIVKVINLFPHIQVILHMTIYSQSNVTWPENINFDGLPLKPIISFTNRYIGPENGHFKRLIHLEPTYLNLRLDSHTIHHTIIQQIPQYTEPICPSCDRLVSWNQADQTQFYCTTCKQPFNISPIHVRRPALPTLPPLFRRLITTRHINIILDFIELAHLKYFFKDPFQIESIKTGIVTCLLERELVPGFQRKNTQTCTCDTGSPPSIVRDTIEDWDQLCINLTNTRTLKRLWLEDFHGSRVVNQTNNEQQQQQKKKQFERLASSFESIWKKNNSIGLVSLSKLPHIISPLFFSTLCHNQSITTLMLINGTLDQEYIPSFCQLLLTNQTIKSLDISGNHLAPSTKLNKALKQNKSIKVLNIADNKFNQDIFDSLLESDTIQYLVIDEQLSNQRFYQHHPYFNQSKSLIKCFILRVALNFIFNSSILLD
ncbi:hypothetical protein DFA_06492 [Cavenderia fasciculata]|uniref:Leucine-rich repeat-containing protein n=1 Tax=Cavenderia fasciculata TaxID=261658 RepID=F4PJ56_CACFS|nr:uncharacterized protein DFA_06492 [Cavenderia fasciculata]EGG24342.1 hypothetical protein DFA_06492 [Cavenderia fasciculata]|eukprot:XP_004362193.1 hypothetical protein DFA_06492 [Cavenderia fasciculata]